LVGTKINGAVAYDSWNEKPNEILEDTVTSSFERDDAWIKTIIDTANLVGGTQEGAEIDQSSNSGISIHHTFHSTENSTTSINKNTEEVSRSDYYKEEHIPKVTDKDDN
jgi:hypothetical protein